MAEVSHENEFDLLRVPDQKRFLELRGLYEGLYLGLRSRDNPVSWRTLTVDLREILGSQFSKDVPPPISSLEKGKAIVENLTRNTYMFPLRDEIMVALYGSKNEALTLPPKEAVKPLEFLLVNPRHTPDPLLFSLADHLKFQGREVAILNPVGHYSDGQPRVVSIPLLIRPVNEVAFIGSTQIREGGDFELLTEVIRAVLRNPNTAYMIKKVRIVIPMFGGSRSHTTGQDVELGYENKQVIHQAKWLTLMLNDIKKCIKENPRLETHRHVIEMQEGRLDFPKDIIISSVDIHNDDLPGNKFKEGGYEFKSISPAKEQIVRCLEILNNEKKINLPALFISCDAGSDERTRAAVKEYLKERGGRAWTVCFKKERSEAGKVKKVEIGAIFEYRLDESGNLSERIIENIGEFLKRDHVLIYVDDMIDTGGTAITEMEFLKKLFKKSKLIIYIASHPIFSKGIGVIDQIGADFYIIGNALSSKGLEKRRNVRIIDFAPAIARDLF